VRDEEVGATDIERTGGAGGTSATDVERVSPKRKSGEIISEI
jgi:hypothetical protein